MRPSPIPLVEYASQRARGQCFPVRFPVELPPRPLTKNQQRIVANVQDKDGIRPCLAKRVRAKLVQEKRQAAETERKRRQAEEEMAQQLVWDMRQAAKAERAKRQAAKAERKRRQAEEMAQQLVWGT